jgi:predicted amidohydrolase YtcJ
MSVACLVRCGVADDMKTERLPASCPGAEELALVNGKILTMDKDMSVASWILVRGREIVGVGTDCETSDRAIPPCRVVVDLEGRTLVPGLIDSHIHFIRQGLYPGHDVRGAETAVHLDELLGLIEQRTVQVPEGKFITVLGGIQPAQLAEKRLPTLDELDSASPKHPVYIQLNFSGPALTNSRGKEVFAARGVNVQDDGTLAAGAATNTAFEVLREGQTLEDKLRSTLELMGYANRVGLTMVFDEGGTSFPGASNFDPRTDYEAVLDLWSQGKATLRIRAQLSSADDTPGRGRVEERVDNVWPRFGDDMLQVVALGEHVVTFPRNGEVSAAYAAKAEVIARAGWPHEQHSTSFEENRQHLEGIEAAHQDSPITDLRWSLTHVFELGTGGDRRHLERLKAMNMGVRVQNHGYSLATDEFPLGRSLKGDNAGPLYRTLVDAGIPIGAGTDGPLAAPMNPWLSIYYMVTGRNNAGELVNPDQTLTRMEALRLYTRGSAWFSFEEDRLGSIEVGKLADLAVLDTDYLAVPDKEIRTIQSVFTLVGGEVVFTDEDAGLRMD